MKFMKNWRSFLTESKEEGTSLLREITEEELEPILDSIAEMDPDEMPFNHLFGNRTRIVLPMMTKGETSKRVDDLEKYLKFQGYDEWDWSKGIATKQIEKEWQGKKRISKKQAKIGKVLQNLIDKSEEADKITEKYEEKYAKLFKDDKWFEKDEAAARDLYYEWEDELEKIQPKFSGPLKRDGMLHVRNQKEFEDKLKLYNDANERAFDEIKKIQKWWVNNSSEFRKDPESYKFEKHPKYSIIISRDPVDILRMSDFDDIQSCHSPASRGVTGQYFHCAVAEAHQGGGIAYVVPNDELEEVLSTGPVGADGEREKVDIDELKGEEIFVDRARGVEGINPVSRLRMRKFFSPEEDIELAIPEERVYGKGLPGFKNSVVQWLRRNQSDLMQKVKVDSDNDINLDSWIRYGGTYTDTKAKVLFDKFFMDMNVASFGEPEISREIEDMVLAGGLTEPSIEAQIAQEEANAQAYAEHFNNRNGHVNVQPTYEGYAVNDGGEGYYIDWVAELDTRLHLPEIMADSPHEIGSREWHSEQLDKLLEINRSISHFFADVDESYGRYRDEEVWFDDTDHRSSLRSPDSDRPEFYEIEARLMQAVFVPHGGEYAWNAEEFSQTLDAMERLDDWAATALKPQFKRWMEQNGFIPKQPLYQFHQELEDEELTYYGWEFDTEGYAEDDELEQIKIYPEESSVLMFENPTDKFPEGTIRKDDDGDIVYHARDHKKARERGYDLKREIGQKIKIGILKAAGVKIAGKGGNGDCLPNFNFDFIGSALGLRTDPEFYSNVDDPKSCVATLKKILTNFDASEDGPLKDIVFKAFYNTLYMDPELLAFVRGEPVDQEEQDKDEKQIAEVQDFLYRLAKLK